MINTYGICIHCGSKDDPEGYSGTAHLLEHLIFNSAIAKTIQRNGGTISAMTQREKTLYICQIPDTDDVLFNKFLSFVMNPVFTSDIIQNEKRNIAHEYALVYKQEINTMIDALYKKIFPKNGLANSIIGYPSSIERINVSDLITFHKRFYCSSNMVIVQTGTKVNACYSPNGSIFSHEYDGISCPYEINTSMPKFGWELSSSDSNIYLCAFPVYIKDEYSKKALPIITDLLQQTVSECYLLHEQKHNIPSQFSFQHRIYNGIGIVFSLIAGSDKSCKEYFSKLREIVRWCITKEFTRQQVQEMCAYREKNNIVRMSDPHIEMNRYLNEFLVSKNMVQFRARLFMAEPQIDKHKLNACIKDLFTLNNMHYYTKCKADMYSLPYIIYL